MKSVLVVLVCLLLHLPAEEIDFTKDVRPILSEYCFSCHGPDDQHREGKLRLDEAEGEFGAYRVRKKRAGIVPGNTQKSHVYLRMITKDEDDIMPPPESKKEMKPEEIEIIKRWIEQGAGYKKHWSFEVPEKAKVPPVKDKSRVRNEMDIR